MQTQNELESWDNFVSGSFLKPINVKDENEAFVCIGATLYKDDRDNSVKVRPRLTLQRGESQWDFDLNKTNASFLKDAGIESPKKVISKKLYFKKALVRNPQTNKEVDGLRICKVE